MSSSNSEPCLLSRISRFYNNKTFSDLKFEVKNVDGSFTTFYAHKLILSMAGERFADNFYRETPPTLREYGSTPYVFQMMLQYVYCDSLKLANLEDATNLFRLAKKYRIKDLMDECSKFIAQYDVSLDTLFAKYEYAIAYNVQPLLPICRKLVSLETEAVLHSQFFSDVSQEVIVDILKLDHLSVSSELEVIFPAIEWCKSECSRKGKPTEGNILDLRKYFLILLKHLRFLTLDYTDIFKITESYKILLDDEMHELVSVLLKEKTEEALPEGFCSITVPRIRMVIEIGNVSRNYPRNPTTGFNNSSERNPSFSQRNHNGHTSKEISREHFHQPYLEKPRYIKSEAPLLQFTSRNVVPKKSFPTIKVMLEKKVNKPMHFEIPLRKMFEGFQFAFNSDLKCNAEIKMLQGSMVLHGIELKVAGSKLGADGVIEVLLGLSGNFPPESDTQNLRLRDDRLIVPFKKPIEVYGCDPVHIEVIIEDLKLNRCDVCSQSKFELNCGLDVKASITLDSNKSNGSDAFMFLISRLVYSVK